MKKNLYQNKKAFTLVETMIVMAIMAIMMTISVGVYQSARRNKMVESYASQIQNVFAETRNLAILPAFDATSGMKAERIRIVSSPPQIWGYQIDKSGNQTGEKLLLDLTGDIKLENFTFDVNSCSPDYCLDFVADNAPTIGMLEDISNGKSLDNNLSFKIHNTTIPENSFTITIDKLTGLVTYVKTL